MKKLTTEEFIEKAKQRHGDKYDYSLTEYHNKRSDVIVGCPEHGEFSIIADYHLQGGGCPKCRKKYQYTTEDFVKRASKKHNHKYDYSLTVYTKNTDKVDIICHEKDKFGNEHGIFTQIANDHLHGSGCPKCCNEQRGQWKVISKENFLKRANKKHNHKYDYSLVEDGFRTNTKIKIICHEKDKFGNEHGVFEQIVNSHLQGGGCPKCAGKYNYKFNDVVNIVKQLYGDTLQILTTEKEYIDTRHKIRVKCHEHGVFEKTPKNLFRSGCPKCGKTYKPTTEEFIEKAKQRHGDKYDYSKAEYINNKTPMCIICPEHGEFWRTPHDHLQGSGCPKCTYEKHKKQRQSLWEMLKEEFEIPTLIESGTYDMLVLLLGNMSQENKEKYKLIDKQIQRMLSLKQYPRTIDELDKYFDIYESEDIKEMENEIDLDDIDSIPVTNTQKGVGISAESINTITKVVEDNIDNFPPEIQEYMCRKLVNDKHRLNILQNGK